MKDLDAIMRRVMPRVVGAAHPVVVQAVRDAASEFCRRTRLWREEDEFQISNEGFEYIAVPPEANVFEIESASFEGQLIEPASIAWLDDNIAGWRTLTDAASKWFTQSSPGQIHLVPAMAGKVELKLILEPADDADRLPDFIVDLHAPVIADGALADLYAMPADYGNPGLAQYHASRFQSRLDTQTRAEQRGQQGAVIRTRPQFL
jgi:hypothetical protein